MCIRDRPKPQNAGRDEVGQDLDQIVERGFMLFAVYENYPPYSWEEAGKPRGVDVDIARLIAEEIGVKAQFNFVSSDENLEADLRNNVWKGAVIGGRVSNVMMRGPYDAAFKCRVEQVVFTGQYSTESIAIDVLKAGFARVDVRAASRRLAKPLLDDMLDAQESARRAHHGVWEYGDIDSDDEH